ncbi:MAG: hypothetical protein H0T72_07970 [Chloroflexia bacterium]|jgi:uncharacterized membrane-anchored protein YhcB (DUF1043 family)|nr:hypothetical protein [Chloroflexia bacterium]
MSWPVILGGIVGLVIGINIGVLLMVALQAGRRQAERYDEAGLRARVLELEAALARPPRPPHDEGIAS